MIKKKNFITGNIDLMWSNLKIGEIAKDGKIFHNGSHIATMKNGKIYDLGGCRKPFTNLEDLFPFHK